MIAQRQNVDIDVIIAANKTPDRYPELVKHSKLKLHTNILLEIPQHISCDTDRHGLLQSCTKNKNSTISTEQKFLIRKQNSCPKSQLTAGFVKTNRSNHERSESPAPVRRKKLKQDQPVSKPIKETRQNTDPENGGTPARSLNEPRGDIKTLVTQMMLENSKTDDVSKSQHEDVC
eukprot:SAG31_NODE_2282_length_6017_cov_16.322237_2_plen_175_part_00